MSQLDDDPVSNPSANPHFSDVLEISMQRRRVLQGGLGAAALAFFGAPALTRIGEAVAQGFPPAPSFLPVPAIFIDQVRVPQGYTAQVLYRWGDPTGIKSYMPPFQASGGVSVNSPADQAFQAGMDHDGMHYFPLDRDKDDDDDDDDDDGRDRKRRNSGLLCINYENIQPEFLLGPGLSQADQVLKMKNAHGMSVIEVRQRRGQWEVVRPSKYARRITADTPIGITGPAAGHPMMRTAADPQGRSVLGMVNNCANGHTPWGTYLTCEENFNGYFQTASTDPAVITQHMKRYGISADAGGFGPGWYAVDTRFDLAVAPNESNRFGWVVEVDPKRPNRAPVKHTALGRLKHENAALTLSKRRKVVVYMGDDERNEYIYKFVSSERMDRHDDGDDLLDKGTLYVAVFEPGAATGDMRGTGRWVPLVFGQNGLTPANGFSSQAEVLIKTRQAADRVGATMMDRPEWIAVHPQTQEVYITLTNNNRRGTNPPSSNNPDGTTTANAARPPVDDANPRANNVFGHILRWREAGSDAAALTFEWDVFLLAGDPTKPAGAGANSVGFPNFTDPTYHIFSAPDGLAFDDRGWLWIETDYGPSQTGDQSNMGNCHMMVADIPTGQVGRFLTGPNGAEITGWTMTPDQRTVFVNIQHPGEGGATNPLRFSTWPDHLPGVPPRSSTIAITKDDGGVIGT